MRVLLALVVMLLVLDAAWAQEPVNFPDQVLKAAVEEALWISDPTPADMLGLDSLDLSYKRVADLSGLEYATNLRRLWIRWNLIADISALSSLVNLRMLDAHGNVNLTDVSPLSNLTDLESLALRHSRLSDISPLAGLTRVTNLQLEWNQISDISPLAGLTGLKSLALEGNRIGDISALLGMKSLEYLNLKDNPLSQAAYDTYIPQVTANNPGIRFLHDQSSYCWITVEAGTGGAVTRPGEGLFRYQFGEAFWLEAAPDPCFVFVGWSGSYSTAVNPLRLFVDDGYIFRANFQSTLATVHVDDDAPADPGPADSQVSDARENGTSEHPFDSIQEAVEVAASGTTVFVHSGTYGERIDLLGKRIELTGFDPGDPAKAGWPVIDGGGDTGPVVSFTRGEDPNCVLRGFVVTGGKGQLAGAVECSASSPTVANCLIVGNRATDTRGAAVYCADSNAVFINCTIADNCAGQNGAPLYLQDSPVQVVNSILWGNSPAKIITTGARTPSVRYSCVAGGWPGPGNISDDPLLADTGQWVDALDRNLVVTPTHADAVWTGADYHLQSQAGRWDPEAGAWVQDAATSPCIDAGDPASPVGDEPSPNGGIINLGAYGGTAEASKSSRVMSSQ